MPLEANKKLPETLSRALLWVGHQLFVSSSLRHARHQDACHTHVCICRQQLWRGWAVRLLLNSKKASATCTELQRSGWQRRPQSIIAGAGWPPRRAIAARCLSAASILCFHLTYVRIHGTYVVRPETWLLTGPLFRSGPKGQLEESSEAGRAEHLTK